MSEFSCNIVIIVGFAGSGSSALIDLLCEFEAFQNLGTEFRLLVDPDGIMSLENALTCSWTPYQSDIAIKRFKKLIYRLSHEFSYPYFKMDHSHFLGKQFIDLSNRYINTLVSFSYNGMWAGIDNPLYVLGQKMNRILGRDLFKFYKPIHVSFQRDRFISITKKYLDSLMPSRINGGKVRNIVLDEGFASLTPSRILDYFYSAKLIIVDRDPRDIFVNALKYKFNFIPHDVEYFIKWYEYMQNQSKLQSDNDDRILRIYFEDLVLNYEQIVGKILLFLSANEYVHVRRGRFFKPDVSVKNVGLWKQHQHQDEIERIYASLNKYCFDVRASGSL